MSVKIITGDCRAELAKLPAESVQCVVTSPPYFGLRDYGVEGQIGLEDTLEAYVETMVAVFREVRRVLRNDGTVFVNLGDSYAGSWGSQGHRETPAVLSRNSINNHPKSASHTGSICGDGLKPKDLMLAPARVALALQADGWFVRSQMPWVKRAAMPESTTDRPATAVEYVFLLTKSGDTIFWQHRDGGATRSKPETDYRWIHNNTGKETDQCPPGWTRSKPGKWRRLNLWRGRDYYFDMTAVRSEAKYPEGPNAPDKIKSPHGQGFTRNADKQRGHSRNHAGFNDRWDQMSREQQVANGRNFRNSDLFYSSLEPPHGLISGEDGPLALDVNPAGFAESHFATFPPRLIEPLIKAGTSEKGCCAACGASWVRDVERGETLNRTSENGQGNGQLNKSGRFGDGQSKMLGWSSSCACDSPAVPCTVLDPFGGAGTTGLVADRLGRNAILIELSPEYAAMAQRRIEGDAPLLTEVSR